MKKILIVKNYKNESKNLIKITIEFDIGESKGIEDFISTPFYKIIVDEMANYGEVIEL